jgi:tRNA(His) guanylyltransferase
MIDFKERELYNNVRATAPVVVRIDGRAFHTLTDDLNFQKPFDLGFNTIKCQAIERFMTDGGFSPSFAATHSDEISILFLNELPFEGRIEKIASTCASYITVAFDRRLWEVVGRYKDIIPSFDARIVQLHDLSEFNQYLKWRQDDSYRNFVQGYAQVMLPDGKKRRMSNAEAHERLFQERQINLNDMPAWQKRGNIVYFESYTKQAKNALTGEPVEVLRNRIVSADAPLFGDADGLQFLRAHVRGAV